MALDDITVGDSATGSATVAAEHFASKIVAGTPDVFSTPALGALVEKTAAEWLASYLGEGQMSVGSQLVINHTAATPEGLSVTVTVNVTGVDGRRIDFEWSGSDGVDEVGKGTHTRFVVDRGRFEERLAQKRS